MKKTQEMIKAEIENLLETEWQKIGNAYRNSDCELGISIKVGLAGNNEQISIVTALEYYPLPKTKVKGDPVLVDEKQMGLPLAESLGE